MAVAVAAKDEKIDGKTQKKEEAKEKPLLPHHLPSSKPFVLFT